MKLAIIGASTGQLPICLAAKNMGIQTVCFSWPKDAICQAYVDKFYPISIIEKDLILDICKKEKIDGVVSNASDLTAEVVSYISTELHLHGIDYLSFQKMKNKSDVRRLTSGISGLSTVDNFLLSQKPITQFPCIIKRLMVIRKREYFSLEIKTMWRTHLHMLECMLLMMNY